LKSTPERERVTHDTTKVIALAAGIIALAGIAAWMGLAHSCEQSRGIGVIAG
jgi:cytochrome c-type biogenesis protein CcmH